MYICSMINNQNRTAMKAQIHIGKEIVFQSNRISEKNLMKKADEIARQRGLMKMEDRVSAEFHIYRSY